MSPRRPWNAKNRRTLAQEQAEKQRLAERSAETDHAAAELRWSTFVEGITFQDNDVRHACKLAEKRGLIRRQSLGPGRSTLHYLIDDAAASAEDGITPPSKESTSCR